MKKKKGTNKKKKKKEKRLEKKIIKNHKKTKIKLWDKIARPYKKPFGLFYPLETCFLSFFIHRTIHLGMIYSVKNN